MIFTPHYIANVTIKSLNSKHCILIFSARLAGSAFGDLHQIVGQGLRHKRRQEPGTNNFKTFCPS